MFFFLALALKLQSDAVWLVKWFSLGALRQTENFNSQNVCQREGFSYFLSFYFDSVCTLSALWFSFILSFVAAFPFVAFLILIIIMHIQIAISTM